VQRRCYHTASKSNHSAVQPAEVEESCFQKLLYVHTGTKSGRRHEIWHRNRTCWLV